MMIIPNSFFFFYFGLNDLNWNSKVYTENEDIIEFP